MLKRIFSVVLFILLVTSILTLAFNIQPVKASGIIYIRADGSIDPPDAPISTVDHVTYTLTASVTSDANGIVVERDNIVIDGAGYSVQGTGSGTGITLLGRSNVTIKNTEITTFYYGIYLGPSSSSSISGNNIIANNNGIYLVYSSFNSIVGNNIAANNADGILLYSSSSNSIVGNSITANKVVGIYLSHSSFNSIVGNSIAANKVDGFFLSSSSSNSISGNNITANNVAGIYLEGSSFNSIVGNNITANNIVGIWFYSSSNNSVFHNNFAGNSRQVASYNWGNIWDDGYPSGGNYWSDYSGVDTNGDGIGDTPYVIDANNVDHYPLVNRQITRSLTITATAGGTTNPSPGTYTCSVGQTVPVQAAPNIGYVFDHWILDMGNAGTDNPISVVMTVDHTLYPVFSFAGIFNLTITTTPGGTTNPTPGTYLYTNVTGTSAQVTAIPDIYFLLDHWELDGLNVGSANPYTVLMDSDHALHAVFVQVTYTLTITTTVGGTTNPVPETYTYPGGQVVPVQAIPNTGYVLDHWERDGTNVGLTNPIGVLMDENHTLHAVFVEMNYTLQITTTVGGTTDPAADTYTYPAGLTIQVTAIPDTGYAFDHWELDGATAGSVNPIGVLMDGDHMLYAVFQLLPYRLTILSSTGGTTDLTPGTYTYVNGTYASVTAIPDTYYLLDYWLLDGNNVGSSNPASVLMTDDHTLQPVFVLPNYTLTITATTGGTTNPVPGAYTYTAGASVQVTAVPDTYYTLDHWELDGLNVGSTNPYTVLMDSDHALHAVFVQINYTLTITTTAGGTTDPSPGVYSYAGGSNVQITAIPDINYTLDYWELDGANVGSNNPISITMDADYTLHAVFAEINYHSLTITVTAGGTTTPTPGTYTYTNGTVVNVQATPSADYIFDHWELDGANIGAENPINVTIDADYTLQAVFVLPNYNLTITTATGGTTDPVPGAYTYTAGASAQVTAVPDANYMFDHWELDGVNTGPTNPISITMDKDHALYAVFVYVGLHDTAITNVASSKTVVGQGYSLNINVTLANQGDYTETFNVTVYYGNGTFTPEQWNVFWHMGDCNRDGYINQADLDIIAANYGLTVPPGDSRADIAPPYGVVGLSDLVTYTLHQGYEIWKYFLPVINAETIVDLAPGDSVAAMFVWNTTGAAYGNYTVTAVADPVVNETNTADNNCTCGFLIHVGVPGDVSSSTPGVYDGVTNMKDIAYLVSLFNTRPNSSNWNPNADVNNDGVVNMKDIAIAVLHFNQHE